MPTLPEPTPIEFIGLTNTRDHLAKGWRAYIASYLEAHFSAGWTPVQRADLTLQALAVAGAAWSNHPEAEAPDFDPATDGLQRMAQVAAEGRDAEADALLSLLVAGFHQAYRVIGENVEWEPQVLAARTTVQVQAMRMGAAAAFADVMSEDVVLQTLDACWQEQLAR